MYTQCPECLTIYKISPQLLVQGRGSVSCGHCTAVFDALRTLTGHQPNEAVGQLAVQVTSAELPRLSTPMLRPQLQGDLLGDDTSVMALAPPDAPAPEFARARKIKSGPPAWPWFSAIAVLVILLLAQIAYAERHELLRSASARPWLERVCAGLGCRLPLAHDPEALSLLSRDVRQHPSVANALIISAMLRNDARVVQAFPIVEITLADLDERRIAMRRFAPTEYVGDTRTIASGLPPGATSALVFEVADPGKNAVAFEFKFL
ncbi:MAG: zinc-ribbon and DUF3426 domain-containing protein [Rudaea sp.]